MTRREFENEIKKLVQLTASQYCGLSRVSTCPHKAIHIIGTFRVKKDQYVFKFENDKNDKHGIKDNMAFDFEIPGPDIGANDEMGTKQFKKFQRWIRKTTRYIESVYFAYDMRANYRSMNRDVFDDYWVTLQRCLHFALPYIEFKVESFAKECM